MNCIAVGAFEGIDKEGMAMVRGKFGGGYSTLGHRNILTTLFLHCVVVVGCSVLVGLYKVIYRGQENIVRQTTTLCRQETLAKS